jgi:23S rRNA (adenine2503-C2)-methyltransferase
MRCDFCLTGKMGLVRNLASGEIVGQVRELARLLGLLEERFNIVLMGMGEPLHNYDNTMKALRMLAASEGLAVSPRRITLSTVALVPGLERLASEPLMPNLAISLHGTTDEQRERLVPASKKYGLGEVIEILERFPLKRRNRITFEYVLLEGVNDSPEDARRLVRLLSRIRAKVNLIPLNEAAGIPYKRPSDERIDRFAEILASRRLTVSVRKSRGRDIRAACGQLIVEGTRKSPAQRAATLLETR